MALLLPLLATRAELVSVARHARRVGIRLPLPSSDNVEDRTTIQCRHALRLFATSYAALNVYENLLLGLLRRKSPVQFVRDLKSVSALRMALFVASFSTSYQILLRLIRSIIPRFISKRSSITTSSDIQSSAGRNILDMLLSPFVPPLLAGIGASSTLLFEPAGQRRVSIALYALARALQGAWETILSSRLLPKTVANFSYSPFLFAAANSVLLHAFVYDPETFPTSLSSFILKYSGAYLPDRPATLPASALFPSRREIVNAIASASQSQYPAFRDVNSLCADPAISQILPILATSLTYKQDQLVCAFLHPHRSCANNAGTFVQKEFVGAAKFFSVLAFAGSLLRYKKTLKRPQQTLLRAILSTVTSSAFLSLSIGTAWSTICLFQKVLPGSFIPTRRFYVQGCMAGLWVALTSIGTSGGGRATDLAMYSGRMAVQTAWEVAVKYGRVRNVVNGEVMYFAGGMGILMALIEVDPKMITSGMARSVLQRLAGPVPAEQKKGEEVVQTKLCAR